MIKLILKKEVEVVVKPSATHEVSLSQNSNGSVSVIAGGWYVLDLNVDGTFKRVESLPKNVGFKVDSNGQIVEEKEVV